MSTGARAVFLDRDGILVDDVGVLYRSEQIQIRTEAAAALRRLKEAGFLLVGVSNQAVVARGLASEEWVRVLQERVENLLVDAGAPKLDGFYFCPHHPQATDPRYRRDCDCRKPRPGMVAQACVELGIDPATSFFVGDRPSDVVAGQRAGCRTIWARTGRHDDARIVGMDEAESAVPDHACDSLTGAAEWILREAA